MPLSPGQQIARFIRAAVVVTVQDASGNEGADSDLAQIRAFLKNPTSTNSDPFIFCGGIPVWHWYGAGDPTRPDATQLQILWFKLCKRFGKVGAPQPAELDSADEIADIETMIIVAKAGN